MKTASVKIGKFDDDAADIWVGDRVVGWLERVHGERFKSVTSYARVSFVSHYTIMLTDDALDEALTAVLGTEVHDVDSRGTAAKAVRSAAERIVR